MVRLAANWGMAIPVPLDGGPPDKPAGPETPLIRLKRRPRSGPASYNERAADAASNEPTGALGRLQWRPSPGRLGDDEEREGDRGRRTGLPVWPGDSGARSKPASFALTHPRN